MILPQDVYLNSPNWFLAATQTSDITNYVMILPDGISVRDKYVCGASKSWQINFSIEQSPSWDADNLLVGKWIPDLLWGPKIHYHVHKSQSRGPILKQLNLVHTLIHYFLKIHLKNLRLDLPNGPAPSSLNAQNKISSLEGLNPRGFHPILPTQLKFTQ
jgi:hypothetical protein